MSFPKADEASKAFFESLVPDSPGVQSRPMFGNRAAFVNLRQKGASSFEPMPGRPMKEYVVLPEAWRRSPAKAKPWVERSLAWASKLSPKKK